MALDRRLDRLEHLMERLEEAVVRLAEAQARTEERVSRLEEAVVRLAEAQVRTEERLTRLEAALERLVAEVTVLKRDTSGLRDDVGALKGDSLERRYRENAAAFFQRILRGIRLVSKEEVESIADAAEARAVLSLAEHQELLRADVVLRGRRRDTGVDTYLLAEVSSILDSDDVERAAGRAALLQRAAGMPVIAAVAGEQITPDAVERATALDVWRVLDGRAFSSTRCSEEA